MSNKRPVGNLVLIIPLKAQNSSSSSFFLFFLTRSVTLSFTVQITTMIEDFASITPARSWRWSKVCRSQQRSNAHQISMKTKGTLNLDEDQSESNFAEHLNSHNVITGGVRGGANSMQVDPTVLPTGSDSRQSVTDFSVMWLMRQWDNTTPN